ncbi:uncharacterized protein TRUGW13939_08818 [Talaromyces rugulosus]|uniref:Uncharacterized protein n=1 Tax=Talaromyces rugulosus TaxID=121627 RepID=A0A7H8R635_TALRU|nr:uncharacterized protein TRUGW13939_08818 [Talaromyces rugulosus]QKX61666.1 hypothetical protein TRUGW13939_08818 [Talaromyces rugulosus]
MASNAVPSPCVSTLLPTLASITPEPIGIVEIQVDMPSEEIRVVVDDQVAPDIKILPTTPDVFGARPSDSRGHFHRRLVQGSNFTIVGQNSAQSV